MRLKAGNRTRLVMYEIMSIQADRKVKAAEKWIAHARVLAMNPRATRRDAMSGSSKETALRWIESKSHAPTEPASVQVRTSALWVPMSLHKSDRAERHTRPTAASEPTRRREA